MGWHAIKINSKMSVQPAETSWDNRYWIKISQAVNNSYDLDFKGIWTNLLKSSGV